MDVCKSSFPFLKKESSDKEEWLEWGKSTDILCLFNELLRAEVHIWVRLKIANSVFATNM